ncbi:hypothetical protein GCM10025734_16010 [Kitasatospora paranensis]
MVLEGGLPVPVGVREGDPELGAVQEPGVLPRRFLGVRDGAAGGHQAELVRAHGLQAAEAVAVQHLALVQPADGLQPHVGVRWHLHAGLSGDVVGPVVVDEAPGSDHPAAHGRQQPPDDGGAAECRLARGQEVADGPVGGLAAAAFGGGVAVEVTHGGCAPGRAAGRGVRPGRSACRRGRRG